MMTKWAGSNIKRCFVDLAVHRPSITPFDSIRIGRRPMLLYVVVSNEAHHTDGS